MSRCVLWHYDVYGFDGGRSRQLCDSLSDRGFLVLMPDWYRGETSDSHAEMQVLIDFTRRHTQWENFLRDWNDKIKPYALKHGARSFGTVGKIRFTKRIICPT